MRKNQKKKIILTLLYFLPVAILIVVFGIYFLNQNNSVKDQDYQQNNFYPEESFAPSLKSAKMLEPDFAEEALYGDFQGEEFPESDALFMTQEISLVDDVSTSPKENYFEKKYFFVIFLLLISFALLSYLIASFVMRPIIKNQKEQKIFIDTISHELRTPLTLLRMELDLFKKKKNPDPQEFVSHLEGALGDIEIIVKQLLFYTRTQNKSFSLGENNFSLSGLIKKKIELFKERAKEKYINVQLNGGDLEVFSSEDALSQILSILMDNAIKYSPIKSEITAFWDKNEKGEKFIHIINYGSISKEKNKKLYTQFFRENNNSEGGLGLGLFLAKELSKKTNFSLRHFQRGDCVVAEILFKK